MATYVIGDLQGCYKPLLRLLEKLHFDPTADKLWLAGDLINRGKHSLETLRFVHSLGDSALSVLGNHDISLISAFHGLRKPHKSLRKLVEAPDYPQLLSWLSRQPILHIDRQLGFAMAHAGIPPQWDILTAESCAREVEAELAKPDPSEWLSHVYGDLPDVWDANLPKLDRHRYILNAFTRMRFCRPDGSLDFQAKNNPSEYENNPDQNMKLIPWFKYPTRQKLGLPVLFGHWSTLGYYSENQVIALDTGCVWGGQLSAIRIDTNNQEPITVECTEYG